METTVLSRKAHPDLLQVRGTLAHTRTHTYSLGALHNTPKALPFNERNLWRLGCSRPDLAINKLGTFFSFLVPFNASPAV